MASYKYRPSIPVPIEDDTVRRYAIRRLTRLGLTHKQIAWAFEDRLFHTYIFVPHVERDLEVLERQGPRLYHNRPCAEVFEAAFLQFAHLSVWWWRLSGEESLAREDTHDRKWLVYALLFEVIDVRYHLAWFRGYQMGKDLEAGKKNVSGYAGDFQIWRPYVRAVARKKLPPPRSRLSVAEPAIRYYLDRQKRKRKK